MIVQIYTMQTPEEARAVAALGVDYIGVTPSHRGLPGEVSNTVAREIFNAVGHAAVRVALSVESDLDEIKRMVAEVQPDILHLCGDIQAVPPDAVASLKAQLHSIKIMQAIPVTGEQSIALALAFQDAADILILDTKTEKIDGIGASGETHDWNISRRIVEAVRLPVILAGGLSPQNVQSAIRSVKPWGVDSLTHTNHVMGEGIFRKDLEKVRLFVRAARGG